MLKDLTGANCRRRAVSAAERQCIDDAAARLSAVAGDDVDAIEQAIKT